MFFHAAGASNEDEPVNAENFAGGEVRPVIDVVRRGGVLVARNEDEFSCVHVGFAEGCGHCFWLEGWEFCCEERGSAYDA